MSRALRSPALRSNGTRTRLLVAIAAAIAVITAGCAGTSSEQVATEATTTSTTPSTSTTTRAPDCASTLPTAGQVAQLLMVMVPDPTNASDPLDEGLVSGFGLKGNQRSDVAGAISAATEDLVLPPVVAVDEEGGTVQRLRYSAGRLPSAAEMAEGTPAEASEQYGAHAQRMAEMGVTMNFAPVADVGEGADLGTRTYGDDPTTVGQFAAVAVEANLEAGVIPVVKHWPGLGSASEDPHDSLPVLDPIDQLRTNDMIAFRAAFDAGAPAVMLAHAEVPGLTAEGEPVSLSRTAITDELRGAEGFGGVVITDSLGMGAIVETHSQAEAAELAISAGADIALLSGPNVVDEAHDQLVDAVESGRIPAGQVEDSVRRVLAMRGIEGECFDAVSAYAAVARKEAEQAAREAEEAEADAAESQEGGGDSSSSTSSTSTTARDTGINDP